ncbi:BQ2448_5028 [Microbotryum intermedium]|uniref:BQ2448_5028 protein n=1 Tax=Microbotryum intermedium TaxID=269621 RepID=A0A238F2Y8_9BASI|nr:BQ2448_5028 [Microbotryum intermedium]
MLSVLPIALLAVSTLVSAGNVVVNPNKPPVRTESGQIGYNDCYRRKDSPSAKCQTLYINSLTDFCLFAPRTKMTVGDAEPYVVSYCTAAGHGSRLMPKGTLKGAHYIRTPHYIQITGVGDFTKINIPKGDEVSHHMRTLGAERQVATIDDALLSLSRSQGGELDPHGADGTGNPKGGIVIANVDGRKVQIQEWTEFISYNEFCIRACLPGKDAKRWCEHIYDVMGCFWNEPGNYNAGSFDTCQADDTILPMGEYYVKGKNGKKSVSTFKQGQKKTPGPHPAGKSSKCKAVKTISPARYPK